MLASEGVGVVCCLPAGVTVCELTATSFDDFLIGMCGVSLFTMNISTTKNVETRVKSHFFVLAGPNLSRNDTPVF